MDTLFEGLQEQIGLKIMDGPRRFSEVDNHEEVKVDLQKNSQAIKVVGAPLRQRNVP